MQLADRDHIASVSYLAADPMASVYFKEADGIPVNHGLAEEIFALKPDLVLAGTYTTRTTVALLQRLGVRVEEIPPEDNFEDVRRNILTVGKLVGESDRARALIAQFDQVLASVTPPTDQRPLAAPLYANAYTSGTGTLAAAVIEAAGYENLGSRLGLAGTERISLEALLLAKPDLLIRGDVAPDHPSLAQEVLVHPALRPLISEAASVDIASRYWICGGLPTAEAVRLLAAKRGTVLGP